jgi:release factor glutamine methyltransferase
MVPRAAAGAATAEPGPSRHDLEAELTAVLGARHEARFIVDEVARPRPDGASSGPIAGPLGPEAVVSARAMAARRAAGEPLQYVFGHWPFRSLDVIVDRRVLIPRPETEQMVDVVLHEARRLRRVADTADRKPAASLVVVDVGTGSGAIALSLATELGANALAELWAVDASDDALAVAASNLDAARQRYRPLPPVSLVRGDWLAPLPERLRGVVDLVVSNPPYVSEEEWVALDPLVQAEPRQALVSTPASDGTPGLAGVEAVLVQSLAWLARPGAVVVELAPHQAAAASRLARGIGYGEVRVEPDLTGRDRVLVARADASV